MTSTRPGKKPISPHQIKKCPKTDRPALYLDQKYYPATLDAIPDPLHIVDRQLRIILFNRAYKKWLKDLKLGQETIGKNIFKVLPFLKGQKNIRADYEKVFTTGKVVISEEVQHFNGRDHFIEVRRLPIREDRQIFKVISIVRDITDRKNAEKSLRESEQKFRRLAETISAGIFIYRGDHYVYANPYAETTTGYSRRELETMKLWDLIHPEFREEVKKRSWARQQGRIVPERYETKNIKERRDRDLGRSQDRSDRI